MSLNTLLTSVAGKILSSHVTSILTALRLQFVGRGATGAPTAGQDLGTETYPWGETRVGDLYADGMVLDGARVVKERVTGSNNAILSGRTRTTSGLPDFIRADGVTNECTILATATPLKLVINGEIVTVSNDIVITGLTSATYNAGSVADVTIAGEGFTKYLGENGTYVGIFASFVGAGVPDFGETAAVKITATGEYIVGTFGELTAGIDATVSLSECYRGWLFDSVGVPNDRDVLSDNDALAFYDVGWIFIQNNGVTTEVVYVTPIHSDVAPTLTLGGQAIADGQYWFDLDNDTWKRHNGVGWEILNRVLLGQVVTVAGVTVGTRSADFDNDFRSDNGVKIQTDSHAYSGSPINKILRSVNSRNKISVYGKMLGHTGSPYTWTMPTDLDTGSETNAVYYMYISDDGGEIISLDRPHNRIDLLGWYHPFESWRSVGLAKSLSGNMAFTVSELSTAIFYADGTAGAITSTSIGAPDIISFSDSIIDNREMWNPTVDHYRIKEGEQYRVSLDLRAVSVNTFTGSDGDPVFHLHIEVYDIEQDSIDFATTGAYIDYPNMLGRVLKYNNTDSVLYTNAITMTAIIPGFKNRAIRVSAYVENCAYVSLNHRQLSITQI